MTAKSFEPWLRERIATELSAAMGQTEPAARNAQLKSVRWSLIQALDLFAGTSTQAMLFGAVIQGEAVPALRRALETEFVALQQPR